MSPVRDRDARALMRRLRFNHHPIVFLLLLSLSIVACSTEPQSHPLNTGTIPTDAKVLDNCSLAGQIACGAWSGLQGDAAVERRPACAAYIGRDGHRVEMCGSLPASLP